MIPKFSGQILCCVVGLAFIMACRPSLKEVAESSAESVLSANAAAKLRSSKISVCWEFASEQTHEFRSTLQSTVSKAFERTEIRLSGWEQCPESGESPDFRLFIYDDSGSAVDPEFSELKALVAAANKNRGGYPGHPHINLGAAKSVNALFGKKGAIILSVGGQDASPYFNDVRNKLGSKGKLNLMVSASLHVIGHAIGLPHEDSSANSKCIPFDEYPTSTEKQATSPNSGSFMQSCFYRNHDFDKGVLFPNQNDVDNIRKLFSASPVAN